MDKRKCRRTPVLFPNKIARGFPKIAILKSFMKFQRKYLRRKLFRSNSCLWMVWTNTNKIGVGNRSSGKLAVR